MSVETELRKLADANNGLLVPQVVVEAARDPNSPLHSHFEWVDSEAARMHRLNQARALIRTVKIEVRTTHFTIQAPAYVRDPSAEGSRYIETVRLRTDQDMAREAVIAEFARASAALRRAQNVAAALGISREIDGISEQISYLVSTIHPEANA